MKTAEDIESYLIRTDLGYAAVSDNIWVVGDDGPDMVVSIAGPVVVFRAKVLDLERVPADKRPHLFRALLQLNANDMLHGAYGIEAGAIVVTDALQLENLDFNEFQAALDDIGMALSRHYTTLAEYTATAA